MQKKIKIKLSSDDIKENIKKLQEFQKSLTNAGEEIVDKLCELGIEEIQTNYSQTRRNMVPIQFDIFNNRFNNVFIIEQDFFK